MVEATANRSIIYNQHGSSHGHPSHVRSTRIYENGHVLRSSTERETRMSRMTDRIITSIVAFIANEMKSDIFVLMKYSQVLCFKRNR